MKKTLLLVPIFLLFAACSPPNTPQQQSTETFQPATSESSQTAVPAIATEETTDVMESPEPQRSDLPNLGTAPELENKVWLNTDHPLRLEDLRGQVVLLEMWTFGCYNCKNVIPSLRDWHETYQEQGLVIIGNHYPEFSYEEDLENLKQAVDQLDIRYPVAQDNQRVTWGAYNNRYWPTLYLIDKRGDIRYVHIGEGAYDETEAAIQNLLAETYP